jgi:phage/plasmid-associated DNA primase
MPALRAFLLEIFGHQVGRDTATNARAIELVRFLQRLVGYFLTGAVTEHVLPISWGDGANGKTTLLNVLLALLGPYAQVAPKALLLDSKHASERIPNDVALLKGQRLAIIPETARSGGSTRKPSRP